MDKREIRPGIIRYCSAENDGRGTGGKDVVREDYRLFGRFFGESNHFFLWFDKPFFERGEPNDGKELADKAVAGSLPLSEMPVRVLVATVDAIRVRMDLMMMEGSQEKGRQNDRRQEHCI